MNRFTLICVFVLIINYCASSQLLLKDGTLFVNQNTEQAKLTIESAAEIIHICFNHSNLDCLDSSWSCLVNVKFVTFQGNSKIPKRMSYFSNMSEVNFKDYDIPIRIPDDFPFKQVNKIAFVIVKTIPTELKYFSNAFDVNFYEINDKHLDSKLAELKSIRLLTIANVSDFSPKHFFKLMNLVEMELHDVIFSEQFVDLSMAHKIEKVDIENTNLTKFAVSKVSLKSITLVDNLLSYEELSKMKFEYQNIENKIE